MAPTTYKDKRMAPLPCFAGPACSPRAGYTVVFKDSVTQETVTKYMDDIVDAGGRLTQTYDWFLNVCPTLVASSLAAFPSFRSRF
jgi:hypothetical protein